MGRAEGVGLAEGGCHVHTFSLRQPASTHSDILKSPKLASELQGVSLGSLLPPRQIQLLEATFLSNEAVSPGP